MAALIDGAPPETAGISTSSANCLSREAARFDRGQAFVG